MAKLTASKDRQYPMVAEFTFNFDDTMLDVNGVEKDFGKTNITATSFAVVNLPYRAVITGGQISRATAFDTASYAVTVGDGSVANRYLTSTDLKATGITNLVPTGYVSDGGNLVIGITNADVCTTGKATLRVEYIIEGRCNEIQTH
jgi:hypothetical protein